MRDQADFRDRRETEVWQEPTDSQVYQVQKVILVATDDLALPEHLDSPVTSGPLECLDCRDLME